MEKLRVIENNNDFGSLFISYCIYLD